MRFLVLVDENNGVAEFFDATKIAVYEKQLFWEVTEVIQLKNNHGTSRKAVEAFVEEVYQLLKEQDSDLLIGKMIIGLPYHILTSHNVILCELEYITQEALDEIRTDFYIQFEEEEQKVEESIAPYPVCIAEDGFYFFDFEKAIRVHKELSSKKMLLPFLAHELFTHLTIKCQHIMPWLDTYIETHGLAMDYKQEDGSYIVNITHQVCSKVGEVDRQ